MKLFVFAILAALVGACLCVLAVQANGAEPDPYAVAYEQAVCHNRPLVVLLSAPWCAACRVVERDYAARLQTRGAYVHLDIERHREIVRRMPTVPAIPAVIVYERDAAGWRSPPRVIVGSGAIRVYVEGK
jgi:hypothetical protein